MIVYFHGLNSGPKSDKVDRLKRMFPGVPVYAFHANVDPEIAKKEVSEQIDLALVENIYKPGAVVFIGTSLGAWLASELADLYRVKSLLINPCYDPVESLKKYPGISDEVRLKYSKMKLEQRSFSKKYAVDPGDEVIDMRELLSTRDIDVTLFFGVGHRFNGPEFEKFVMDNVKY